MADGTAHLMDLETVSTDELVDELQKRFDHVVFAAVKEMDQVHDASDVRWKGSRLTCAGLAQWANRCLLAAYAKERNPRKDA